MQITLLCVGKVKEAYLREAIAEYKKRLTRYTKVEILEVADEPAPENLSHSQEELVKEREGQRMAAILDKMPDASVIALDRKGTMPDSVGFANKIQALTVSGKSHLVFLIGGSLGLCPQILSRAAERISFSALTFPHQLMRVITLEQIYRAFRILRGEPYHK